VNFKNTRLSSVTEALLRFSALQSPHNEKKLSTYAFEAGIDIRSNATGTVTVGHVFCLLRQHIEDCSRCFQFQLIQTSISPAQPQ